MNETEPKVVVTQEQEPSNPANPNKWNKKFVPGDDKLAHGLAGFLMAFGLFFLLSEFVKKSKTALVWLIYLAIVSITVAIGIMYGKEVMDAWGLLWKGCPDIWDMYCGLVGICLAIPFIILWAWVKLNKETKTP